MRSDCGDEVVQLPEAVGEGVGELDAGVLVVLEEVREAQFVGGLVFGVGGGQVGDAAAAPPPLVALLDLAVADLHALAVQGGALCETFHHEVTLAPQSLHAEVEPG